MGADNFALDQNENNFANDPVFVQVYHHFVKSSTPLRREPDLATNGEVFPGALIAVTVLSMNNLSDAVRRRRRA